MATPWPFRHLGLKIVSIVLAGVVWLIVAGDQTVERGLRVPLEFQQFPPGLELVGEPPTGVDVRIRGAAASVARMSPGEMAAVLDLRSATAGRRLFQITPEHVRVPFGIEVVQVAPATVAMAFERSARRQVPVVPVVEGVPSPGFVIGPITSDPQIVEVIGPESAVANATEALTETVNVDGAHAVVVQDVTVGFLDPSLRLSSPRRATVTVQVRPGPRERSVRGRPVLLRSLNPNLTAQARPVTVDVVLRGTREGVGRVPADRVIAYVNLEGLGVGEYSLTVHVDVPTDAGVASVEPPTVQVTIDRARD
jgi:YbbR domain-containing protein